MMEDLKKLRNRLVIGLSLLILSVVASAIPSMELGQAFWWITWMLTSASLCVLIAPIVSLLAAISEHMPCDRDEADEEDGQDK
jgi:hypothetical protein